MYVFGFLGCIVVVYFIVNVILLEGILMGYENKQGLVNDKIVFIVMVIVLLFLICISNLVFFFCYGLLDKKYFVCVEELQVDGGSMGVC